MVKYSVTVVFLILSLTLVQATRFRTCQYKRTIIARPGNYVCIPYCPPRKPNCFTVNSIMQIQSCTPGCCRSGNKCISLR